MVFDPSGEPTIQTLFDPSDPPLLIEAPEGSPPGVVWLSLARRMQQFSVGLFRSHTRALKPGDSFILFTAVLTQLRLCHAKLS